MKKIIKTLVLLIIFFMLIPEGTTVFANSYETGVVTIDTPGVNTLNSKVVSILNGNPIEDIITLNITEGELTDEDVMWITEKIINLENLNIIGDTTFEDDDLPDDAFMGCKALTDVSLSKVIKFGDRAFKLCNALKDVQLPEVTTFGNQAFCSCEALTHISLPEATSFGSRAFECCTSLEKISLPKASTFGEQSFNRCDVIEDVNLPEATTFGNQAFCSCKLLKKVSLPKVTEMGDQFFYECKIITKLSLPEATTFGSKAFEGCTALSEINLPEVTTFGTYAFKGCTVLKEISLPKVTTFGREAFCGCCKLITMTLGNNPPTTTHGFSTYMLQIGDSGKPTIKVPESAKSRYDGLDKKLLKGWHIEIISANNNLSNLTISNGILSPEFKSEIIEYTTSVAISVTEIKVTPTKEDELASIKINGKKVGSGGETTVKIPLDVAEDTISVVLTAENGTTKEYKIILIRAARIKSDNNNLSNLTISNGNLLPEFKAEIIEYTTRVAISVTEITVTPTKEDITASIQVNGRVVKSGQSTANIRLNVGENIIKVVLTAKNGDEKTYTIKVIREARVKSGNNNLSNISISNGNISPVFEKDITAYTASVGNKITEITVTPTKEDITASIKVNGNAVKNGEATVNISLNEDENTIRVVLTAEDGTTKEYKITVIRQARVMSGNNNLSKLTINNGNISPVFEKDIIAYTASVVNKVTEITVTTTKEDITASIKVNENAVKSGELTANIPLNEGENTIRVVLTAENGDEKTYTITVIREARVMSGNNNLSNLTIGNESLIPEFKAEIIEYTTRVAISVKEITVTPIKEDITASIKVNGNAVKSGESTANIPLNVGENTINIIVTAENGDEKIYRIIVTREDRKVSIKSDNNNLSKLTISNGKLIPVFEKDITAYTASVENKVTEITVTPIKEDITASIKVNGSAVKSGESTANIPLGIGKNKINIVVTAENGEVKTYMIIVTREYRKVSIESDNNNLSKLTISNEKLIPVFEKDITAYTASVENKVTEITVTSIKEDKAASIKVNGSALKNGESAVNIPLSVDKNKINIVVTAENGNEKIYTIIVTREDTKVRIKSDNNNLSKLTISIGKLIPVFEKDITAYSASVENKVTEITVTPTNEDITASIKVNGKTVKSGESTANIPLGIGENKINIVVTAENGDEKIYTIIVTRSTSDNNEINGSTTNRRSTAKKQIIVKVKEKGKVLSTTVTAKEYNNSGSILVKIDNQVIEAMLKKKQRKSNNNELQIVIKTEDGAKEGNIEIELSKDAMELIPNDNNTKFSVKTAIGTLTFDTSVINSITKQVETENITINMKKSELSELSDAIKVKVGNTPVFDFSILDGNKKITNFGDKNIEINLPYELKIGENKESIVIYYIDENGEFQILTGGFDEESQSVKFKISYFSKYAIGYNHMSFKDVNTNNWYYSSVYYISAREITKGTDENYYSPNAKITRGQILVMFMRAYGLKPLEKPIDNFDDAGNTYYTNYLAKAKELKITKGIGDNLFEPDKEIKRKEMFTLLYNVLSVLNKLPENKGNQKLDSFQDLDKTDLWAEEAVKFLVEAEIISGSNGKINLNGTATRAEMAQLLYNLLN